MKVFGNNVKVFEGLVRVLDGRMEGQSEGLEAASGLLNAAPVTQSRRGEGETRRGVRSWVLSLTVLNLESLTITQRSGGGGVAEGRQDDRICRRDRILKPRVRRVSGG